MLPIAILFPVNRKFRSKVLWGVGLLLGLGKHLFWGNIYAEVSIVSSAFQLYFPSAAPVQATALYEESFHYRGLPVVPYASNITPVTAPQLTVQNINIYGSYQQDIHSQD
jgi:hypothetical protein